MIPIVAGLLMGAAMGGGIAALQKKNVLEGALMGAVGGAAGSFLMPAAGAAGAAAGTPTAGAAAVNAFESALPGAADTVIGAGGQAGIGAMAPMGTVQAGTAGLGGFGGFGNIGNFLTANKGALMGGGLGGMMARAKEPEEESKGNIREFDFNPGERNPLFGQPGENYYTADRGFTPGKVTPVEDYTAANGGIISLAEGGGLETQRYERPMRQVAPEVAAYNAQLMERANAQYNINPRPGPNQVPGFDSGLAQPSNASTSTTTTTNQPFVPAEGSVYADLLAKKKKKEEGEKEGGYRSYESGGGDPSSNPDMDGTNSDSGDNGEGGEGGSPDGGPGAGSNANGGLMRGYNQGGISSLGTYSDGGQLLRGPGDGVSDGIPAQIGARQPARLADGEFVVPARVVSELGNGSTDAGAKRLYAMMDRVQKNRRKSVGKGKVAVDSKAYKHLPA